MITFDALTLKAFVKENGNFFVDSRIQKIQQPTRRDFIIYIRKSGESRKLYININPQLHHICFMSKENEGKRRIEIPQKPPMFCMLLRKHLENARICKINQPENERIFEIYAESYNELNEKIYLCLAIELMGKHSNIILYNYDTNIILGCAHNVGSEKSRERELAGTLPYIYPPKQIKNNILEYNGGIDYENLQNDFHLFSKAFAEQCKGKNINELKSYVNLINITPAISADNKFYSLYGNLISSPIPQKDVNTMIDSYFAYYQEKDKLNSLKTHFLTTVRQRINKTQNSLQKMTSQIKREENCDKYRLYGDLIMANLYSNKDYTDKITVYDYENNKNIIIDLNPVLTLKENANKFYKQYNKGKISKQKLSELKEELAQNFEYLKQLEYSINNAETYEDLIEISPEIEPSEKSTDRKKQRATEPEQVIINGYTIFIGKNNRQNDYIVSKLSKDEDLWFHTKDCAGSHVLLRGENPDNNTIFECAKIAKKYSSGSMSSKVGVIYTKRKYLKKPPKANLGYVTYKNEKEIVID